ncbi:MAG: hypothetical protein M1358_07180 [Chloroflexi bacterium]|nr:hypothetical protein [Chloroflexota bacterium]
MQVDNELLEKIDDMKLTRWAGRLREEFFNTEQVVSSDRARLTVESWKETEGEPYLLRRAKVMKKIAEELPLALFPGQMLASNDTRFFRGVHPHVDCAGTYLIPLLEEREQLEGRITMGGPEEKGCLADEDFATLVEAIKFWKGKTVTDRVAELSKVTLGSWYDDLVESGNQRHDTFPPVSGSIDYERLVAQGVRGFIEEAKEQIRQWVERNDDDIERLYFWQAAIIGLEAVLTLARRHAELAREMAARETDPEVRSRLEGIAETCSWVPEHPARSFREAVQSVILVCLALKLEAAAFPPGGWGLPDQYLYPHFKRDWEEGRLTLEDAFDLINEFLLFAARCDWVMDVSYRDHSQKGYLSNLGIAGPDRAGEDASNELSYLILHVAGLVKYAEPHIAVRWQKDTPSWLMRKALETNWRAGGGIPQFQNSDHVVNYLFERGADIGSARYWQPYGCSQALPWDEMGIIPASYLNIPLCVDLALHNGIASQTGKRVGLETGDARNFLTFDDFLEAFKKQARHVIHWQLWHDRLADQVRKEIFPRPLTSVLVPGCLESGKDITAGGCPRYSVQYKKDRGIVSAADSLVAVKSLVFDEQKIDMSELLEALDGDFADERGQEIRQMCLSAPKYGNDLDAPDGMARDVGKYTAGVLFSEKNIFGWPYAINRNGQAWHWMAGKRLAATPDGRKAGEPLADGSLSAMQGMDRSGPTALLNSALKADFKESTAGILTIKLSAPLCQTQELRDKIISLTEGFFKAGGTYIQYNIVDASVLRDAKLHPEKYRDLVVRVGGFSAYFIHLSPEVQDEIIQRTEHSLSGV